MSEARLTQLEIANAKLSTSLEHLTNSVNKLTEKVEDLNDSMNKGRGALWVIVGASTLAGGAISAALTKWLTSGS